MNICQWSDASSFAQWMEMVKTTHVPSDEGVAVMRFAEVW